MQQFTSFAEFKQFVLFGKCRLAGTVLDDYQSRSALWFKCGPSGRCRPIKSNPLSSTARHSCGIFFGAVSQALNGGDAHGHLLHAAFQRNTASLMTFLYKFHLEAEFTPKYDSFPVSQTCPTHIMDTWSTRCGLSQSGIQAHMPSPNMKMMTSNHFVFNFITSD